MSLSTFYFPDEVETSKSLICLGERGFTTEGEVIPSAHVIFTQDEDEPRNVLLAPYSYDPEDDNYLQCYSIGEISCRARDIHEAIVNEWQRSRTINGVIMDIDATRLRQSEACLLITFEQGDGDDHTSFVVSDRRPRVNRGLLPFLASIVAFCDP